MKIEISEAQAAVLRELLDRRVESLSTEIRHTDSRPYRDGLRNERDQLRALLRTLGRVAA